MAILPPEQIKAKIRAYILDNFLFSDRPGDLSDTSSFQTTRIIDSMGMMELIYYMESEFGFAVQDTEMIPDNLDSVDRMVAYVLRKKAGS